MVQIKIDGKTIGDNSPCYTIAEAGANHDGEIEKAFKLIDNAINAKSDSIKFQTYKASKLTTKSAPKFWDFGNEHETQFDVYSRLDEFDVDEWKIVFEYAKKKKITCFSTPFDEKSVDLLYALDMPAFKIASADITHLPLIKYVARKNLPIFISTGMASDEETENAVNTIEDTGNDQIIIMHCMTSYPTKPEDANLEIIRSLKAKYPKYVIGYSDHTIGTTIPICSTFYGAKAIEKHFTFDNDLTESPDHRLSLDTKGFSELVTGLRLAEVSKGVTYRNDFDCESKAIKFARRSIVSTRHIPKGTVITKEMLDIKRPATGIYPKFLHKVIGSTTTRDIEEDVPIQWADLSTTPN